MVPEDDNVEVCGLVIFGYHMEMSTKVTEQEYMHA